MGAEESTIISVRDRAELYFYFWHSAVKGAMARLTAIFILCLCLPALVGLDKASSRSRRKVGVLTRLRVMMRINGKKHGLSQGALSLDGLVRGDEQPQPSRTSARSSVWAGLEQAARGVGRHAASATVATLEQAVNAWRTTNSMGAAVWRNARSSFRGRQQRQSRTTSDVITGRSRRMAALALAALVVATSACGIGGDDTGASGLTSLDVERMNQSVDSVEGPATNLLRGDIILIIHDGAFYTADLPEVSGHGDGVFDAVESGARFVVFPDGDQVKGVIGGGPPPFVFRPLEGATPTTNEELGSMTFTGPDGAEHDLKIEPQRLDDGPAVKFTFTDDNGRDHVGWLALDMWQAIMDGEIEVTGQGVVFVVHFPFGDPVRVPADGQLTELELKARDFVNPEPDSFSSPGSNTSFGEGQLPISAGEDPSVAGVHIPADEVGQDAGG